MIQIIHIAESIPFDVAPIRTVQFDHLDPHSTKRAQKEIIHQIRSIERSPTKVETPISTAVELKSEEEIISILRKKLPPVRIHTDMFYQFDELFNKFDQLLQSAEGKGPTQEQLGELRNHLCWSKHVIDVLFMAMELPYSPKMMEKFARLLWREELSEARRKRSK